MANAKRLTAATRSYRYLPAPAYPQASETLWLQTVCAADLRDKFKVLHGRGNSLDWRDQDMLARDLEAIANVPTSNAAPKTGLVIEAIKANPTAGDREIARLVNCSAMTVGRTRAKTGAKLAMRTVKRGNHVYTMKSRVSAADAPEPPSP